MDVNVTLNHTDYIMQPAETFAKRQANETLLIQKLSEREGELQKTAAEKFDVMEQLNTANNEIQKLRNQLMEAEAEIQRLKAPPVVVVPDTKPPVNPKPTISMLGYLVDNESNSGRDARIRDYVDETADTPIQGYVVYISPEQMKAKLPAYITDRKKRISFDNMEAIWRLLKTDASRADYIKSACDIAGEYLEEFRLDDCQNRSTQEIEQIVTLIHTHAPGIPVSGSFGAYDTKTVMLNGVKTTVEFDIEPYKKVLDLVFRQFYLHDVSSLENRKLMVTKWLNSGRITDGVDLEAYKEGLQVTTPAEFEDLFTRCVNYGIRRFTIYELVRAPSWHVWDDAINLWNSILKMAEKANGM